MSIAQASFADLAPVYVIPEVQTVDETRRQRLELLIKKFGTIAALNAELDMDRTDATFSQIRNQAVHSKSGKPRVMGDDLARKIEEKLGLERGWMDTPPGSELYTGERIEQLHGVAEQLQPYQVDQWIAIGRTLAQSPGPQQELELVRENSSGSLGKSADTARAETAGAGGASLASSARTRVGRLFDPNRKKDGAVDDDGNQSGRTSRKGDAGGGRRNS
jgi:hypothetical protein